MSEDLLPTDPAPSSDVNRQLELALRERDIILGSAGLGIGFSGTGGETFQWKSTGCQSVS